MQDIRWKEPEVLDEIEMQRALAELPARARKERRKAIFFFCLYALLTVGIPMVSSISGEEFHLRWHNVFFLVFLLINCFLPPNPQIEIMRASYRINKFGVTELEQKIKNIPWKDIESYCFEDDERAANLRVLIVEARNRTKPLRLYFEGENLEARLRDAMQQGVDETLKKLRRDGDGALMAKYEIGE